MEDLNEKICSIYVNAFLTTFCVLGVDLKDITSYKCGDSEDVVKYDFKSIGDYI